MGTDIHAGIEYQENGHWRALVFPNKYYGEYDDEPEHTARLNLNRDYQLFALLGDVRNSHGFAGCDTGDRFDPITSNRGLPDDITSECKETACTGDHSETWVGLQELLDFNWQQVATRRGIVDPIQFEKWDRLKSWRPQPDEWCGDVSGPQIVHISEDEMRAYVKGVVNGARGAEWDQAIQRLKEEYNFGSPMRRVARITWRLSYAECGKQLWTKILPHMLKLGKEHGYGNVRLVMNFDS